MKLKSFVIVLAVLAIAGVGVLPAFAAQPNAITVTPSVVGQTCLNRNTVQVTLTATTNSPTPAQYRWDFTNNGSFDTARLSNPTVVHNYPDEMSVTARVAAGNAAGDRAQNTVTFRTPRCN